jgi:hypothetical protein
LDFAKVQKIPTHNLQRPNNETFSYKYDLVAIRLFTTTKYLEKSTKWLPLGCSPQQKILKNQQNNGH